MSSGLDSTFGIQTEATVGVPVAVTRFYEYDSESVHGDLHFAEGTGMRGGALYPRAVRSNITGREAAGDVTFDVPTNGFGKILQHMLGSFSASPSSIGGGLFEQVHDPGTLDGNSFTTQIVRPDTAGGLATEAFTYTGCKVTAWELSAKALDRLIAKVTIDALDELTPSNSIANTTTSASAAAGASTISTVATIAAGTWITIDTGLLREVAQVFSVSGAGPFTLTLTNPLGFGHASGVAVGSATGVSAGSAVTRQTAAYTAGAGIFDFSQLGSVIAGGTTSVSGGKFTNANGQSVANIRSFVIKGTNPLKVDRWGNNSKVRSEQIQNNWRKTTVELEVEYSGRRFYEAYAAHAPLALYFPFTGLGGAFLSFYMPATYIQPGAVPQVASEDIIIQKLTFDVKDDGTNGALEAVYRSTDATL